MDHAGVPLHTAEAALSRPTDGGHRPIARALRPWRRPGQPHPARAMGIPSADIRSAGWGWHRHLAWNVLHLQRASSGYRAKNSPLPAMMGLVSSHVGPMREAPDQGARIRRAQDSASMTN